MKSYLSIWLFLIATLVVNGQKTSSLPAGASVSDSDLFVDVQSGVTTKVTGAQIKTYAATGGGGSGTVTNVSDSTGFFSISNPTTTPAFTLAHPINTSGSLLSFAGIGSVTQAHGANLDAINGGTWTGANSITTLGTITSGQFPYSLLSGAPTIPAAQVNSDWNAVSGLAQILNKPTTLAGYGISDAYTKTTSDTRYATAGSGVTSFNTRTGAVTFGSSDLPATAIQTTGTFTLTGAYDLSGASNFNLPIAFKINGATVGTGVSAALINPVNGASGPVVANASGYAAPNVSATHSGFLFGGFSGGYGTGRERGYILFSVDGIHYNQIHGFDNYNPTLLSSGNPTGIRDVDITKIGSKYFISHTITTTSAGLGNFLGFSVVSSPDLVNWTHVSDNFTVPMIGAKWFNDPATGNEYATGEGPIISQNTSTTNGLPDGVTWATPVNFALAGGGNVIGGNPFIVKKGATYYLFAGAASSTVPVTAAGNVYHVYSSSSLLTGYTDLGAITSWDPTEGLGILWDNNGTYWAYSNPRSGVSNGKLVYSQSTTLLPGSWSTMTAIPWFPAGTKLAQSIDDGGGFTFSDADTFSDVARAMENYVFASSLGPDVSPGYQFPQGLVVRNTSPAATGTFPGTGTISVSGTVATGTGTLFTRQLAIGSQIFTDTTHFKTVIAITSDTVCQVSNGGGWTNGVAFTYTPPLFSMGVDPGFGNGGIGAQTVVSERMGTYFGTRMCNFFSGSTGFNIDLSSGWYLRDDANAGNQPFKVDNACPTNALHITPSAVALGQYTTNGLPTFTGGTGTIASLPTVSANLTAQTAAVSSLATITPSANGTYRVDSYLTVTAIATDVIQTQVTYTDETSTSRTVNLSGLASTAGIATTTSAFIRAKSGSAITVLTTLTTGGGTITYDAGANIQQVN